MIAVLPQENIHKMKLKLLLNRLLIFLHFFFLRAVYLGCGIQSLVDFICLFMYFFFFNCGTIGCNMYLCQKIFAILILCQAEIIKKRT